MIESIGIVVVVVAQMQFSNHSIVALTLISLARASIAQSFNHEFSQERLVERNENYGFSMKRQ